MTTKAGATDRLINMLLDHDSEPDEIADFLGIKEDTLARIVYMFSDLLEERGNEGL